MNINVPDYARAAFWDEPPEGTMEFWAFRFKPACEGGDDLYFRFDGKIVAHATVAFIEPPGKSEREHSGKYRLRWKVFFYRFEDLRALAG